MHFNVEIMIHNSVQALCVYYFNVEIKVRLIEVISGQELEDYLQEPWLFVFAGDFLRYCCFSLTFLKLT